MNRTVLIILGLLAALLTVAGIMWYNNPLNTARRQLHDPNWEVRCKAIKTLVNLGAKESAPEILKLFLNGDNYYVCRSAAKALGQFGNKEAIPYIAASLHSEIAYARFSTIFTLMDLKAKEFIPEIKKMLGDKEEWEWVHIAAEDALRKLGVPEAEIKKAKEEGK